MSTLTMTASSARNSIVPRLLTATLPALVLIILVFFALEAPGFLSWGNLSSLILNNFVLLAIVAVGMTWAVAAGGIDLSVGTAVDFASLGFVSRSMAVTGWALQWSLPCWQAAVQELSTRC